MRQLMVLAGLTGFAISQPLLSILGDAPTELAFYGLEGSSVVALAAVIAFVPPLALWGLTRVVGAFGGPLGRWLHLLLVAGLVGLFAIQLAKTAGLTAALTAALAVLAGAAFALAYVRSPPVATWASYTAILPVMAVGVFLLTSPASALLGSVEAPGRTDGGDLPPVVMIIIDELPTRSVMDPDGGIDDQRFPSLAAFARDATWYRHHTTIATHTEVAVPSMLTGQNPTDGEAIWTNHEDNLFTLLAPTHELEVLEQATQLCPYDMCAPTAARPESADRGAGEAVDVGGPGFADLLGVTRDLWLDRVSLDEAEPAALDDFLEDVTTGELAPVRSTAESSTDESAPSVTVPAPRRNGDPAASLTSSRANVLIESFDPSKGPAFYYLHLILPHQPWLRYPDGQEYGMIDWEGTRLPDADHQEVSSWSPWTSAVSEQRHLLQAQYADEVVGQLLGGLRATDLYDDAFVIVVSDHGVSFEAHTSDRAIERSTIDAIGYAPLLIKEPHQSEARVDDSNVTSLDLLPTIADRLGLAIPWPVDGEAIGSRAIEERGTTKKVYDRLAFGGSKTDDILEYDDRDFWPTVADRIIGPLADPADSLSALHAHLGVGAGTLGARLDDLVTDRTGSVAIDGLDRLRQPADEPPLGVVTGRVSGGSDDAVLVLAVDGVVIGGSKLSTDSDGGTGYLSVLLPPGSLATDNDIRAALVMGGEVVELEVRSG